MAINIDTKLRVLGSSKVQALTHAEFQDYVDRVQALADALGLEPSVEGVTLLDLAFAGLLWSEGLLDPAV